MGQDIRDDPRSVSLLVRAPRIHTDISRPNVLPVPLIDVILRANMHKAHSSRRHAGNRVIPMRNTVVPSGLICNVVAQLGPRDARRAKGIQGDSVAVVAQLRRGQRRDRAAKRVPGGHDLVARIRLDDLLDCGEDLVARIEPGLPEAAVRGAAAADVGVDGAEVEVGQPVVDGGAAAEGDDDEVVGGVDADVACYVCAEGAGVWLAWVWLVGNEGCEYGLYI